MVYKNLRNVCAHLDKRHLRYRFELLQDIPWDQLSSPGIHLSDHVLERSGINVAALHSTPEAHALFQWSAALEICQTYRGFKSELLGFIDEESLSLGPVRSLLLLYQEQRKHHKLFQLYETYLRSLQPGQLLSFDKHYSLQPQRTFTRFEEPKTYLRHWQIWLRAILITEFSIHLANEIQYVGTNLHPVWLQVQRVHQLEQYQHLATISAHLEALDLTTSEAEKEAKLLWNFIPDFFQFLLPLTVTKRLVVENYPHLENQITVYSKQNTQFYADLTQSPQLQTLRKLSSLPLPNLPPKTPTQTNTLEPRRGPGAVMHGVPYKNPPNPKETLVDRFIATISSETDRGLVYILNDGQEFCESYRDLFERSKNALDFLRRQGVQKNEAVMLQISRPENFLTVFWGAILGGMVPVPLASMMTLGRGKNELDKTASIFEILGRPLLVTDCATKQSLETKSKLLEQAKFTIATVEEALSHQSATRVKLSPSEANDTAFIQFSSGSTGSPKGVCLSHQNLLHNIVSIIEHQDGKPTDCFVSWLPLFHDMGIIGYHLLPLVLQAKQVLMPPRLFMKRPLSWLQALDRHQGTCTASPNFGLTRVISKLDSKQVEQLSLHQVHCLLNGSEPISAEIMNSFVQLLEPAGFPPNAMSPGYGLAEGSLCISARPAHSLPEVHHIDRRTLTQKNEVIVSLEPTSNSVPFVEVGTAVPGVSIRIVDESDQIIAQGRVGHIQIRGPNVTKGYYRDPSRSAKAFNGEWFRTGDLGLILDGRLIITGRHKDVIFVGGQNFYSHDIEESLADLPWFEPGRVAVFGSNDPKTGRDQICLAGVFNNTLEAPEEQVQLTLQRVSEVFGIRLDFVIRVRPNEIPKTSSGKLQRHKLRETFENRGFKDQVAMQPTPPRTTIESPPASSPGTTRKSDSHTSSKESLPEQPRPSTTQSIAEMVTVIWADVLQADPGKISVSTSFNSLGGSSLQAAEIHAQLEETLQIFISHEMLNIATTPAEMANFIMKHHPQLQLPPPRLPRQNLPAEPQPDQADYTTEFERERQSRLQDNEDPQDTHTPALPHQALKVPPSPASPPVTLPSASSPLVDIVHETWLEILQVSPERLELTTKFTALGGTSLQAAEIHATLEDKLGVIISHEMLNEADTIESMAAYINRQHPKLSLISPTQK